MCFIATPFSDVLFILKVRFLVRTCFIMQFVLTATPFQEDLQFLKICPLSCTEHDETAILK